MIAIWSMFSSIYLWKF